jgi:hypothetical protein
LDRGNSREGEVSFFSGRLNNKILVDSLLFGSFPLPPLAAELANFASIIRILKSRKDVFGKAPIAVPQQAKAKMLMELKADHTAASREELNIEKQLNAMLHE